MRPRPADRLNAALDRLTEKFGSSAVTTADLAEADVEEEPERPRRS